MMRWRSTSASSDDVCNLRHRQRFWTGDVIHARLIKRRQSCPQKCVDGILDEEWIPQLHPVAVDTNRLPLKHCCEVDVHNTLLCQVQRHSRPVHVAEA